MTPEPDQPGKNLPEAPLVGHGLKKRLHVLIPQLFPEDLTAKLRALSVTTAEEFVGIAIADGDSTADFLGLTWEATNALAMDTLQTLPQSVRELLIKPVEDYSLGALPPENLQNPNL